MILVENIKSILSAYLKENPTIEPQVIYHLNKNDPGEQSFNKILGEAYFIPENKRKPLLDNGYIHLLSLDLKSITKLFPKPTKNRTISWFISSLNEHEAYGPYNSDIKVVLCLEEELGDPDAANFDVELLTVPSRIFTPYDHYLDLGIDADNIPLAETEIQKKIYNLNGIASLDPIWLQSPQQSFGFIAQFDEKFIDMNLGDKGIMYLFNDTGFFQCY